MNVGILTYHFSNNYGAVLQAYALTEKLRQLGHTPLIINRTPIKPDILHRLYRLFNSNSSWFWRGFRKSALQYLKPMTEPFYTDVDLACGIKRYPLDAIIVGSDQIWRNTMCGYSYFLNFLDENSPLKRISYAASFGISHWDTKRSDTQLIKDLLHRFDNISVRENSGIEILDKVFGVKSANLVLDPTMLHDAGFYEDNIIHKTVRVSPSGKVVSYILGKSAVNMVALANQFATDKELKHKDLYWLKKDLKKLGLLNFEGSQSHIHVEEWLREIRDAEYIVTNSFHCAVFSILFKKRFVVLEYELGGNDRLRTLLDSLNIGWHLCSTEDNISEVLERDTDYDMVFNRLSLLRDKSTDFIVNALD